MQKIEFIYNLKSYQRDNGVMSDFGEICIKVDSFYFPEKGWTDFGCKAVYIWSQEFLGLLSGAESRAECNFYDGAFLFLLERIDDKVWKICFVDEDSDKSFERKFYIDPIQISVELLRALKFMKNIRARQEVKDSITYYEKVEQELALAISSYSK